MTVGMINILKLFPESARFSFAKGLGTLGYKIVKSRRITALANLKLAFPEKSQQERERIALKSFQVMAKAFLSTLWFDSYLKNNDNVKVENIELLDKAHAKGKGVVIATMHMGNMEASLKIADKYHVLTVAKKQKNPYIDKFITENREKLNITLLKKDKGTSKKLFEALERKSIVALFSDHRDKGAEVEFFGENTIAPTGAVSLALKYDVPLILGFNVLNDDNTCTAHIYEEIEMVHAENFKESVKINTQILIDKMEKIITEYPEQWMWFHDRWKLYKKVK
jgi:KDO2-lipid IV(A) lauroyltransferase